MLATTLEVDRLYVEYFVHTDVPLFRQRIAKMGWRPTGDPSTFVRRLDHRGDVEQIHRRFALHLEEIVLQSARLAPVQWETALDLMIDRLEGTGIEWWLYGSAALAVRGARVSPGDVDFAVSNAIRTGELFEDFLVEPVTELDGWVADAIGRAFHGALFEWLSAPHPDHVPHEHPPLAGLDFDEVRWRGRSLKVPPLGMQLAVARARGREDIAAAIWRLESDRP